MTKPRRKSNVKKCDVCTVSPFIYFISFIHNELLISTVSTQNNINSIFFLSFNRLCECHEKSENNWYVWRDDMNWFVSINPFLFYHGIQIWKTGNIFYCVNLRHFIFLCFFSLSILNLIQEEKNLKFTYQSTCFARLCLAENIFTAQPKMHTISVTRECRSCVQLSKMHRCLKPTFRKIINK